MRRKYRRHYKEVLTSSDREQMTTNRAIAHLRREGILVTTRTPARAKLRAFSRKLPGYAQRVEEGARKVQSGVRKFQGGVMRVQKEIRDTGIGSGLDSNLDIAGLSGPKKKKGHDPFRIAG